MDWFVGLSVGFYLFMQVALTVRIVMRRRPVGVTLAWVFLLFAIPLAGIIAYLLFGERYLGRIRAQRGQQMLLFYETWLQSSLNQQNEALLESSIQARPLHALTYQTQRVPVLAGNQWQQLSEPDAIFDALLADIVAARQVILMEFYICDPEGRVEEILQALADAVQRGVSVYLMLDSVGSKPFLRSKRFDELRDQGIEIIEVLYASPFRMLFRRQDLRQHRKIVAIDSQLAYTGSMNLADPRYFQQDAGVGQWCDLMVRLEGPIAPVLQGSLVVDWEMETGERLTQWLTVPLEADRPGAQMQVMLSGPGSVDEGILLLLLTAIYTAQDSIVLTTPYFVPDDTLVHALKAAALRGVAVKIILPKRNNSLLAEYAGRSFYEELLLSGVEIHRFYDGLLHTKCVLIDNQVALIGTVNLDMRSLWLNFEVTLLVDDQPFAHEVRMLMSDYLGRSRKLSLNAWRRRSFVLRVVENLAQLFSPLL